MLEINNICYSYPNTDEYIIKNFSLKINRGDRIGLQAANGTGKTTLSKILAGHINNFQGSIFINGENIKIKKGKMYPVQLIFQDPFSSVNPYWKISKILKESPAKYKNLYKKFGCLDSWKKKYPYELSGGELQKVSLVRSLQSDAKYFIFDEVSSMFDPYQQEEIWDIILKEIEQRNITSIIISHSKELLDRLCTSIVTL